MSEGRTTFAEAFIAITHAVEKLDIPYSVAGIENGGAGKSDILAYLTSMANFAPGFEFAEDTLAQVANASAANLLILLAHTTPDQILAIVKITDAIQAVARAFVAYKEKLENDPKAVADYAETLRILNA